MSRGRSRTPRQRQAVAKPAPHRSTNRNRIAIAVSLAVAVASAAAAWMLRDRIATPQLYELAVPDPDTTGMQPRVARGIEDARQFVAQHRGSDEAWGRLGEVCHTHALLEEATTCYRQAMTLAPKKFRWAYLFAIARRDASAGSHEIATLFQRASKLDPNYAPAYVHLADALAKSGKSTEAAHAYRRALQVNPQLIVARRGLGQLLLTLGDVEGAVSHLQQVRRAVPRDGPTRAALTQAYMRLGDRRSAETLSTQTTRLKDILTMRDPVWEGIFAWNVQSSTLQRKAFALVGRGDFRGAIPHLLRLEKLDPTDTYVHLFLAQAYVETGQLSTAERHFERMLGFRDKMIEAKLPLTVSHLDEGIERYLTALAKAAMASQSEGYIDGAIKALSGHRNTGALAAVLNTDWGDELIRRGAVQPAIARYETATRLDPAFPRPHYMLGQIMESLGQMDVAVSHYRRAAELAPRGEAAKRLRELQLD